MNFIKTIVFTVFFSSSAFAADVYLDLGESITIGNKTVYCGSGQVTCGSLDKQRKCRLTFSDGTCREYETTFYARGAGECTEDCRAKYSDGTCREQNKCQFVKEDCCFKKKTCRLNYSDGTCREWEWSRCGDAD